MTEKRPRKKIVMSILGLVFIFVLCGAWSQALADALYLKDDRELRGIVIEDFVDRITFSTIDGEESVLKSDIAHIKYDEPEDNLISLGNAAFEKGYHKAALKYYMMAQDINPEISQLDDKIYRVEAIIYNAPEERKRQHLAIKNEIMSGEIAPPPPAKEPALELKQRFGIEVSSRRGRFYIKRLSPESPFRKGGAEKGDAIVAVWSKLSDYFALSDLCQLLVDTRESFLLITIERDISLEEGGQFDASIGMQWEGVIVNGVPDGGDCGKAGLKLKDHIVAIDGEAIRYAPLKTVERRLANRAGARKIAIRRDLNIIR